MSLNPGILKSLQIQSLFILLLEIKKKIIAGKAYSIDPKPHYIRYVKSNNWKENKSSQ